MRPLTVGVCMMLASAGAATARAQSAPARPRVRISANAGVQPSSIAMTSSATRPVYAENETVTTTYNVGSGAFFDGGVLVRLAGPLHVGVSVSSFMKQNDADIASTIPHPFFYNAPRSVAGVAGGLERSELVTHLQAA